MSKLRILIAGILLLAGQAAFAGEVDSLFVDARGSFRAAIGAPLSRLYLLRNISISTFSALSTSSSATG